MSTQVREKPAAKHDSYIAGQLNKAEGRIRLVDFFAAVAGFAALVLAFAVVVMLLDRAVVLTPATRQFGLIVFLGGISAYVWLAIVRPMRWRVNPHYAARQLERTMAGDRNHVVNWIDLHDEKVPGVLRTALGQRAAKDLADTDVEQAISTRRATLSGVAAGLLFVLFVGLFLLIGPRPFASLLGRAFAPFGRAESIATRTQIQMVRPAEGNLMVSIGSAVTVVVEVTGRVPDAHDKDAPALLYRHDESEPYRRRPLTQDVGFAWGATVSPIDVGTGFTYKVTAGDTETPEYRVSVRATPMIGDFLATYRARPYVQRADRSRITRKLEDLRGTEVSILTRTNRAIKDGRLDFDGEDGVGERIPAEVRADDPQALRFKLTLSRSGKYRIRFTSTEGEAYLDAAAYDVVVTPDHAPEVRLTVPGKDVSAPLNGHVEIAGEASDDIGVAAMKLQMQVVGGAKLQAKGYLADKLGKPEIGTPRRVEYKDVLDLTALKDEAGKAPELKAGMKIEYWLEAADACDAPKPNVGASARFTVQLTDAKAGADKEKNSAQQKQKDGEKQQEQQLKNEKGERDKQKQKEEEQEKADADARGGNDGNKGEEPPKDEKKEEGPGTEGDKPEDKDNDTKGKAQDLKDALDKKGGKEQKPGEAKDENKPGENKPGDEKKPGEAKDNKDKGGAGEQKDAGDKGEQKPGEAKEAGKPEDKGEGKEGGQPKAGENKPGEQAKPKQGEGKGEGKPEQGREAGEAKGGEGKQGEAKEAGQPKEGERPGEQKDGMGGGEKKGEGKEAGKPGEKDAGAPKEAGNENKPGAGKTGKPSEDQNAGENKGNARDATREEVERLGKEMKGKDAKGREKAKEQLQEIKDKAGDGDVREAAKKELDGQPGKGKPGPEKGEAGEAKPGEGSEGAGKGNPMGDAEGKGEKPGGTSDKEGGGEKDDGNQPGAAKGEDGPAGNNPGEGMKGDRRPGGDGGGGRELPAAPEKAGKHRASVMQLEEFRKKVDPNVLRDLKWSEEQFKQFLKDYEALARKQEAAGEERDVAPPAGSRAGPLPTMGGRAIKPSGPGKTDVRSEGTAKPPPEYRDAHQEFLRQLRLRK